MPSEFAVIVGSVIVILEVVLITLVSSNGKLNDTLVVITLTLLYNLVARKVKLLEILAFPVKVEVPLTAKFIGIVAVVELKSNDCIGFDEAFKVSNVN